MQHSPDIVELQAQADRPWHRGSSGADALIRTEDPDSAVDGHQISLSPTTDLHCRGSGKFASARPGQVDDAENYFDRR